MYFVLTEHHLPIDTMGSGVKITAFPLKHKWFQHFDIFYANGLNLLMRSTSFKFWDAQNSITLGGLSVELHSRFTGIGSITRHIQTRQWSSDVCLPRTILYIRVYICVCVCGYKVTPEHISISALCTITVSVRQQFII